MHSVVKNINHPTSIAVVISRRTMMATRVATPMDRAMEKRASLRPMMRSMTAKVEMQGM